MRASGNALVNAGADNQYVLIHHSSCSLVHCSASCAANWHLKCMLCAADAYGRTTVYSAHRCGNRRCCKPSF